MFVIPAEWIRVVVTLLATGAGYWADDAAIVAVFHRARARASHPGEQREAVEDLDWELALRRHPGAEHHSGLELFGEVLVEKTQHPETNTSPTLLRSRGLPCDLIGRRRPLLAGRGFGKTRTGADRVSDQVINHGRRRARWLTRPLLTFAT